jgi:hypothetical protein
MTTAVSAADRKLRDALVWNGALQMETTIDTPRAIVAGNRPDALLPLPTDAPVNDVMLLSPVGNGYKLHLAPDLGGAVWRGGMREDVSALKSTGDAIALGPDDYGVVTLGQVAFFFQHVKAARKPGFSLVPDATFILSQLLSAFFTFAYLRPAAFASDRST